MIPILVWGECLYAGTMQESYIPILYLSGGRWTYYDIRVTQCTYTIHHSRRTQLYTRELIAKKKHVSTIQVFLCVGCMYVWQ